VAKTNTAKNVLALLFLAGGTAGIVVAITQLSGNKVKLQAGWNTVTYRGKEQPAPDAFVSIIDYLVIAYYWDGEYWQQVTGDTIMVPGGEYNIQVSQDCTWVL
jgi:hypothetical protein